jgi:hypothetical protein
MTRERRRLVKFSLLTSTSKEVQISAAVCPRPIDGVIVPTIAKSLVTTYVGYRIPRRGKVIRTHSVPIARGQQHQRANRTLEQELLGVRMVRC